MSYRLNFKKTSKSLWFSISFVPNNEIEKETDNKTQTGLEIIQKGTIILRNINNVHKPWIT